MRGKRLPKELKEAQGTLRSGRDSDLKFTELDNIPTPPEHWSDRMIRHYYRIAKELQDKGILFNTDIELLKTYVVNCEEVLKHEILMQNHDILSKEYKQIQVQYHKFVDQVKSIGGKFGFNPVDKSKVWVYADEDGDSLKGFLKGIEEL